MKKLFKGALALLIALPIVTSSNSTIASEVLTGAQLKKLFPGPHVLTAFGFQIKINASAAGGLSVSLGDEKDSGNWSVKGDQLCISLKELTEGKFGCGQVKYDGKKYLTVQGITFTVH